MTVRGAHDFVVVIGWALLPLGLLSLLRSLLVIGLARRHVRLSAARIEGPRWFPPVTVLVPAYNEAVGIERAKHALVASDYPELEVVVLDDGSTDGTGDLVEALGLPNVRLVRQPNGGEGGCPCHWDEAGQPRHPRDARRRHHLRDRHHPAPGAVAA